MGVMKEDLHKEEDNSMMIMKVSRNKPLENQRPSPRKEEKRAGVTSINHGILLRLVAIMGEMPIRYHQLVHKVPHSPITPGSNPWVT